MDQDVLNDEMYYCLMSRALLELLTDIWVPGQFQASLKNKDGLTTVLRQLCGKNQT